MDNIATVLKALGHPERLRILALLSHGELTVSELVQILGFSQPRITQYIKSLEAAGVLERLKEGSWVFSRLRRADENVSAIATTILTALPEDDPTLRADLRRLTQVRAAREAIANDFFARVANDESQLGDEYLPQADIERAMRDMLGAAPYEFMIDLGTGTGRTLEVFADQIKRGTGIDSNTDMLKVARHKLAQAGHAHISVRQGDLRATPLPAGGADLVTLHQVLHYLDDPNEALAEVARLLGEKGCVLIVDYAAHELELFREKFAHRRLGFSDKIMTDWMASCGLELSQVKAVKTGHNRPDVKLWLGRKLTGKKKERR